MLSHLLGKTTHTQIFRFLVLLAILYIFVVLAKHVFPKNYEGFVAMADGGQKFVVKRDQDAYDAFYAHVYNEIYMPETMAQVVAEFILTYTQANPVKSVMLDVGSGTGEQVAYIQRRGFNVYGIESSQAMVDLALERHPGLQLKVGNVIQPMMYDKATFSHIVCTGVASNVLYTLSDKRVFFQNCYHWLMPNGYLILQLVDRARFDPIPPSGKSMVLAKPQQYATERITESEIEFVDFQYKSAYNFHESETVVVVTETFADRVSKQVRKQEFRLYMEEVDSVLLLARQCGFLVVGQTNLEDGVGDEHQYLYLLERPN